mmetsp:Transcript_49322/g.139642  ORF Transcript_49322/g.139642 Transcript_49322/m.139642 type:complete len:90 (-) Transcript_49322:769-1038(-)
MSSDNLVAAEAKKKEGNDAFAKKEYEAAIGFYSEAIELDPQNHIYYSNRRLPSGRQRAVRDGANGRCHRDHQNGPAEGHRQQGSYQPPS